MMEPMEALQLAPHLAQVPRLLLGLALYLLPGIAAADRLLPGGPVRFLLAPVLSLTLMPVAALLLAFGAGLPITAASTALLAFALTLLFGMRRLVGWLRPTLGPPPPPLAAPAPPATPRPRWRTALPLAAVALLVASVHALPHLPGGDSTPLSAWPDHASRLTGLLAGRFEPFPAHVDEHTHLAYAGHVLRNGTAGDPYTGERADTAVFSLRGVVHERGFHVGLAQLSQLSGASLPFIFSIGAAVWAALLAALAWAVARPGHGALASAALVAAVPTDVLFIGPSYLVPIGTGLAWVLAAFWVTLNGRGPGRIAALLVLLTGAFFIHLVAGGAALVATLAASAWAPGDWRTRASVALSALLPLAWIGPAVSDEVVRQLGQGAGHTLSESILAAPGLLFWVAAAAGVAFAVTGRSARHRAVATFAAVVALCVGGSFLSGRPSLALYYRAIPVLALAAAILAGHAVGSLVDRLRPAFPAAARAAVATAAVAILVAPGISAHLDAAIYRVHDGTSWQAGEALVAAGAGPGDVFLADPWRAMVYNGATGATPYTVLRPGSAPEREADWGFYLLSGGADAAWLADRGIDYVVSDVAPNAPHESLGSGAYRIIG